MSSDRGFGDAASPGEIVEIRPVAPSSGRLADQGGDPTRIAHADLIVGQLDEEIGQTLLGLAIRSGLAPDAAEDAAQEALLRLWLELRRGVDVLDPRAWLLTTVYRLAMDEHRFRRRAGDLLARLSIGSQRTFDPDAAQAISIWQLVDRLPTRQRQVLYLRYKADMSFEQVGSVMGITASAARAHAAFATERLRLVVDPTWDP